MESERIRRCPSEADLTVYYDMTNRGERTAFVLSLRDHVEHCPVCSRKLRSYQLMDRLMDDVLAAPAGLSERIKMECHRVAEDDQTFVEPAYMRVRAPWWTSVLGRVAAMVIGLGVIGGVWYGASRRVHREQTVQVSRGVSVEGRSPSKGVSLVYSDQAVDLNAVSTVADTRRVSSHELIPVGLDARYRSRQKSLHSPKALGEAVRHVWMVDDLASSRKLLAKAKDVTVSFASGKSGRLIAHIDGLTDRSLQKMVEGLESRNWALVSPMLPQPGQSERVVFNDHPVSYTVWIVEKNQ